MSSGPSCKCGNREAWRCTARLCNHSAFSGYRWTPSEYSEIVCDTRHGGCGARWRTKAAYVATIPNGTA